MEIQINEKQHVYMIPVIGFTCMYKFWVVRLPLNFRTVFFFFVYRVLFSAVKSIEMEHVDCVFFVFGVSSTLFNPSGTNENFFDVFSLWIDTGTTSAPEEDQEDRQSEHIWVLKKHGRKTENRN